MPHSWLTGLAFLYRLHETLQPLLVCISLHPVGALILVFKINKRSLPMSSKLPRSQLTRSKCTTTPVNLTARTETWNSNLIPSKAAHARRQMALVDPRCLWPFQHPPYPTPHPHFESISGLYLGDVPVDRVLAQSFIWHLWKHFKLITHLLRGTFPANTR